MWRLLNDRCILEAATKACPWAFIVGITVSPFFSFVWYCNGLSWPCCRCFVLDDVASTPEAEDFIEHSAQAVAEICASSVRQELPKNMFMCIYCPKTFSKRDHLTRHERSHTGERPFGCSQCIKRFGDRSTLRQHMLLVHSSRLPYKCTECEEMFQWRQELKSHRRSHLGIGLHECSLCGGQFLSRLGLSRHQLKTHNTSK